MFRGVQTVDSDRSNPGRGAEPALMAQIGAQRFQLHVAVRAMSESENNDINRAARWQRAAMCADYAAAGAAQARQRRLGCARAVRQRQWCRTAAQVPESYRCSEQRVRGALLRGSSACGSERVNAGTERARVYGGEARSAPQQQRGARERAWMTR